MSFGENLQYLRSEAKLTQEQLAEQLEVSRQSVSKWESDTSFPEMDKLLVLCELFHCDLDTLLRGDAEASRQSDTAGYDAHMNHFSKMISAGVVLCICGLSAASLIGSLTHDDRWSGILFLLFMLASVVLFIIGRLQHKDFCENHPHIELFYDKQVLAAWRQRFPIFIASGTAVCIGAVILFVSLEGIRLGQMTRAVSESVITSGFLLLIAAGVGLLVYGGIQQSKYQVEKYNQKCAEQCSPHGRRLKHIHGAIMLIATGAFLFYWYFWKLIDAPISNHGIGFGAVLIFGFGWLLCGVANALIQKRNDKE